jgi:hypothetical protein
MRQFVGGRLFATIFAVSLYLGVMSQYALGADGLLRLDAVAQTGGIVESDQPCDIVGSPGLPVPFEVYLTNTGMADICGLRARLTWEGSDEMRSDGVCLPTAMGEFYPDAVAWGVHRRVSDEQVYRFISYESIMWSKREPPEWSLDGQRVKPGELIGIPLAMRAPQVPGDFVLRLLVEYACGSGEKQEQSFRLKMRVPEVAIANLLQRNEFQELVTDSPELVHSVHPRTSVFLGYQLVARPDSQSTCFVDFVSALPGGIHKLAAQASCPVSNEITAVWTLPSNAIVDDKGDSAEGPTNENGVVAAQNLQVKEGSLPCNAHSLSILRVTVGNVPVGIYPLGLVLSYEDSSGGKRKAEFIVKLGVYATSSDLTCDTTGKISGNVSLMTPEGCRMKLAIKDEDVPILGPGGPPKTLLTNLRKAILDMVTQLEKTGTKTSASGILRGLVKDHPEQYANLIQQVWFSEWHWRFGGSVGSQMAWAARKPLLNRCDLNPLARQFLVEDARRTAGLAGQFLFWKRGDEMLGRLAEFMSLPSKPCGSSDSFKWEPARQSLEGLSFTMNENGIAVNSVADSTARFTGADLFGKDALSLKCAPVEFEFDMSAALAECGASQTWSIVSVMAANENDNIYFCRKRVWGPKGVLRLPRMEAGTYDVVVAYSMLQGQRKIRGVSKRLRLRVAQSTAESAGGLPTDVFCPQDIQEIEQFGLGHIVFGIGRLSGTTWSFDTCRYGKREKDDHILCSTNLLACGYDGDSTQLKFRMDIPLADGVRKTHERLTPVITLFRDGQSVREVTGKPFDVAEKAEFQLDVEGKWGVDFDGFQVKLTGSPVVAVLEWLGKKLLNKAEAALEDAAWKWVEDNLVVDCGLSIGVLPGKLSGILYVGQVIHPTWLISFRTNQCFKDTYGGTANVLYKVTGGKETRKLGTPDAEIIFMSYHGITHRPCNLGEVACVVELDVDVQVMETTTKDWISVTERATGKRLELTPQQYQARKGEVIPVQAIGAPSESNPLDFGVKWRVMPLSVAKGKNNIRLDYHCSLTSVGFQTPMFAPKHPACGEGEVRISFTQQPSQYSIGTEEVNVGTVKISSAGFMLVPSEWRRVVVQAKNTCVLPFSVTHICAEHPKELHTHPIVVEKPNNGHTLLGKGRIENPAFEKPYEWTEERCLDVVDTLKCMMDDTGKTGGGDPSDPAGPPKELKAPEPPKTPSVGEQKIGQVSGATPGLAVRPGDNVTVSPHVLKQYGITGDEVLKVVVVSPTGETKEFTPHITDPDEVCTVADVKPETASRIDIAKIVGGATVLTIPLLFLGSGGGGGGGGDNPGPPKIDTVSPHAINTGNITTPETPRIMTIQGDNFTNTEIEINNPQADLVTHPDTIVDSPHGQMIVFPSEAVSGADPHEVTVTAKNEYGQDQVSLYTYSLTIVTDKPLYRAGETGTVVVQHTMSPEEMHALTASVEVKGIYLRVVIPPNARLLDTGGGTPSADGSILYPVTSTLTVATVRFETTVPGQIAFSAKRTEKTGHE